MSSAPDTAPDVLAFALAERRAADASEANVFLAAAAWADQHSADTIASGIAEWDERAMPLAGEGTPEVAEFCIAEFAAVLGMTTHAGRALIGDALETRHRLPKVWHRVTTGTLQVWRARQIAHLTYGLPPEGAAYVDEHVAAFAHRIGYAALQRLLEEAKVRFLDGYESPGARVRPDGRKVKVNLGQISTSGTADIWGELDYADAADLERAIARRAGLLGQEGAIGEGLGLDARRALALGEIARDDLCLDLATGERSPRQGGGVELKVHVNADDLADDHQPTTSGLARVERTGGNGSFITLDTLRAWLQRPDATISARTSSTPPPPSASTSGRSPTGFAAWSPNATAPAASPTATARPTPATSTTSRRTTMQGRPARRPPTISLPVVGRTIVTRLLLAGATPCSTPATTCGDHPTVTASW